MKKVVKRIMCIAMLIFIATIGVVFSACGSEPEMPPSGAAIYFNGGEVVTVGNYLYFANGYKSYSELTESSQNEEGKVKLADLVRVKLKDGEPEYDEAGNVKNMEVIVSKIAGSENSSLFVLGDYIYFSSPNIHKTNQNQNQFNLISLFRVKLNGSGLQEIYTTPEYSNGSYTVLGYNSKHYLVIFTGTRLVKFEIGKNVGGEMQLASEITGIALPKNGDSFNGEIYFTTERPESDTQNGITGNMLKKVNIETGVVTVKSKVTGTTNTIVTVDNNDLIYTQTVLEVDRGTFRINIVNFSTGVGIEAASTRISPVGISKIYSMGVMTGESGSGIHRGYVFVYQNRLMHIPYNSMEMKEILSEAPNILFTRGDYVYYASETSIKRVSRFGGASQTVTEAVELITTKADFDDRYVYFYAKAADEEIEGDEDNVMTFPNYSMFRVSTIYAETGTDFTNQILAIKKGEKKATN